MTVQVQREALIGNLAELSAGQQVRVLDLDTSLPAPVARRLWHLGLRPGTVVEMIRAASFGGPAVFRLRGYELCLRRAQARAVRVHVAGGVPDGVQPARP